MGSRPNDLNKIKGGGRKNGVDGVRLEVKLLTVVAADEDDDPLVNVGVFSKLSKATSRIAFK
uniref:Uncharacterized protein n=1 Tax=Romanomermis culicivorax TaxID=13658 RepID=A0A915JBB8_ROMCU